MQAPGCQGYLVIDARGTKQDLHPWVPETYDFFRHVNYALDPSGDFSNVVQLGDLNGTNNDPTRSTLISNIRPRGVDRLYSCNKALIGLLVGRKIDSKSHCSLIRLWSIAFGHSTKLVTFTRMRTTSKDCH
jgi:hypothetical protein